MQGSMTKEQKDAGFASVFKRDDGQQKKRKELDAQMRESAFIPDAYGECYPGYHELGTAVVDDDEADFTAMDSKVCWPVNDTCHVNLVSPVFSCGITVVETFMHSIIISVIKRHSKPCLGMHRLLLGAHASLDLPVGERSLSV